MIKKLIALTMVSLAIFSASFADTNLNIKNPPVPQYKVVTLYSIQFDKTHNMTSFNVVNSKGEIHRFNYFDMSNRVKLYINATYYYDDKIDYLKIINGKEVLFDEESL